MQFFVEQAQARQRSRRLLGLFILLLLLIVLTVNAVAHQIWLWVVPHQPLPHYFYFTNSAIIILLIVGGAWIEIQRLRAGGTAVAEMAGGQRIQPNSRDPQERRLLNVVEEMSLASGVSMPAVYVLDHGDSINAFAAGHHLNDVAIAVTRGALIRLTRDELQGVVAHEFSHILNGDMALNLRLLGLIFGLQMIADFGHWLLNNLPRHSSRDNDQRGTGWLFGWFVAGLTLLVLGYIGQIAGRILKASLSRQREFLADASAVQFTRQVDGIGGALRKIGGLGQRHQQAEAGSFVIHPSSERLSHLYLGPVNRQSLSGWFSTHPPLATRLQRLYGRTVSYLDASPSDEPSSTIDSTLPPLNYDAAPASQLTHTPEQVAQFAQINPVAGLTQTAVSNSTWQSVNQSIGQPGPQQADFAQQFQHSSTPVKALLEAAREPYAARNLVYAMLWSNEPSVQALQTQAIATSAAPPSVAEIGRLTSHLQALSPSVRLPLLDMAMPALRLMAVSYQADFLRTIQALISADKQLSFAEFVLQTIVQQRLLPPPKKLSTPRYRQYREVSAEILCVFGLISRVSCLGDQSHLTVAALAQLIAARDAGLTWLELPLPRQADNSWLTPKFEDVRNALGKLQGLAPLQKPALLRACVEVALWAQGTAGLHRDQAAERYLSPASADLLRALCTALDAPLPPQVDRCYTEASASLGQ